MAAINYTSFDFETIKSELLNFLSKEDVFKDYNFNGSNINTMMELVAGVGDLFGYYTAMVANESFIQTAELYENLNKLAELVGYNPGGYKSSIATLTLTTSPTTYPIDISKDGYKISIPRFSKFTSSESTKDGDAVYFTNPSELIYIIETDSLAPPLSGASLAIEIPLVQGSVVDVGSEAAFTSDGSKYQKFVISDAKALEEYIMVTIDDGVNPIEEWEKVDNIFQGTTADSKVYTTRFNKNKKVEIRFGNDVTGKIPPNTSTIKARYISSLGGAGNINANLIADLSDNISEIDTVGNITTLSLDLFTLTHDATIGGNDPETEEDIRNSAPSNFRAQQRLVTKQDYEDLILANFNDYVLKSKALNYSEIFPNLGKLGDRLDGTQTTAFTSGCTTAGLTTSEIQSLLYSPLQSDSAVYFNNVYVTILPKFGDFITNDLRNKLTEFLDKYKISTINHIILEPTYIKIDVRVSYTKTSSTPKTTSELVMNIRNTIRTYFDKTNRDLGEIITISGMVDELLTISGIKSVIVDQKISTDPTLQNEDIVLSAYQFPKLNTLTII